MTDRSERRRPRWVWLAVVATIATITPGAVSAQTVEEQVFARRVELVPASGTVIGFEDRRYRGLMIVSGHDDGLALGEQATVDRYLEGIAEVPFGWEMEALRTQAVAARTYLSWTLARGRTSSGARYGYDICATTACQVYSGVGLVEGPQGERWREAVESTADEILVFEGSPAQALYSSTSGGRTRNVEDVFPGATAVPYLRAVASPDEDSPFVSWGFNLTGPQTNLLFAEAGLGVGEISSIVNNQPGDGEGSWTIRVVSAGADTTTKTWELRTMLNRAASVLPDVLPSMRPNGRRYPQTILSPNFEINEVPGWIMTYSGPPLYYPAYRFEGNGWGHNVGMSQYGAQAMAEGGALYPEILAHFYGGLRPEPAGDLLPSDVIVGLATERQQVALTADGPVTVIADGQVIGAGVLGDWAFEASGSGVVITPPTGLGLTPGVSDVRFRNGVVAFDLNTTALVEVNQKGAALRRPGGLVYALKPGSTVVTITLSDSKITRTFTLRVPPEYRSPDSG